MKLLADMFHRGNVVDIAWFLGGAWLLFLFLALLISKLWRNARRKRTALHQDSKS